ncbi:MAG: hypothetical protein PSN34_10040 [Urechidicola sp.]|nr:hypothetical protein [Urechidicola sp.]
MSDKQMDRLDALTSKMVKETPQETPSINFSKNVMDTIYALETEKELKKNQPLISKKIWFLFVAIIIAATLFLIESTPIVSNGYLSNFNLSKYTNSLSLDMDFGFTVSNITVYGFIFLAIMVSVQIGYIKNYYNRQYN